MILIIFLFALSFGFGGAADADTNRIHGGVQNSKSTSNVSRLTTLAVIHSETSSKTISFTNPATSNSTKTSPSTTTSTTTTPSTTTPTKVTPSTHKPTSIAATTLAPQTSCKGFDQGGNVKEGVYTLILPGNQQVDVYCSSGYVTIQRRYSGLVRFHRSFSDYEQGFGDVADDHWLGLKFQHEMTKSSTCSLRVLLGVDYNTHWNIDKNRCGSLYAADCDGKIKEILAENFSVSSDLELYRIHVTFNRTDFLHPDVKKTISKLNGQQFTAQDKGPQWLIGCAAYGNIPAGFWYDGSCYPGYPNSVWTTDTKLCSSSNKVCGYWTPYHLTTSWIQFRC